MGPRIILHGAMPFDSNIGGCGHRPQARLVFLVGFCSLRFLPHTTVTSSILSLLIQAIYSKCTQACYLGVSGRSQAVQPVVQAVLPLDHLVTAQRLYRSRASGSTAGTLTCAPGRYYRCWFAELPPSAEVPPQPPGSIRSGTTGPRTGTTGC